MIDTIKEIFTSGKEYLSFLFRKAKTKEDRWIKLYDLSIFILVIFMLVYGFYLIHSFEEGKFSAAYKIEATDISTNITVITPPNVVINGVTNLAPPTIVSVKPLKPDEFFLGEVVGMKYFGVYGIVIKKTLTANGYFYKVRWRNLERDLPTDDFYDWELYRPPASLPVDALEN